MAETLFNELKRYVGFSEDDQRRLRELHPVLAPEFTRIADIFYARILHHEGARKALSAESQVGRLKVTLAGWMDKLFSGPWDEDYAELRLRIGRVHVRIALPQHYMMAAMNIVRREINAVLDREFLSRPADLLAYRNAVVKVLDLDLALMLDSYREDLLAQQARTERLSTFGQLVASIGHELRNPLGVMETSLFILRQRLDGDERAARHVERISQQIGIANDIITKLLDMIRDRPLSRSDVKLGELLTDVVGSVSTTGQVEVRLDDLSGLPPVAGDAVQLRQVFLNLIQNAVQALDERGLPGTVRIHARADGDVIEVRVEDSGPGVDPAVLARLFEPLVTTRARGIGLGLALVKRIVDRHGGSIRHLRPDAGGACFVVRLPISV